MMRLGQLLPYVLVIAAIIGGVIAFRKYQQKVVRLEGNLTQTTEQYRTVSGLLATTKTQLQVTKKELKAAYRKDSSSRSAYEKELAEAHSITNDLRLRPADVKEVTKIVTVSNDSGLVSRDSLIRFPITVNRKHYSFKLYRQGDSILHNHSYWNSLYVVVSRERYFKDGSRIKHPKWYFWKDWKTVSTAVSDDSSATVDIPITVKFVE